MIKQYNILYLVPASLHKWIEQKDIHDDFWYKLFILGVMYCRQYEVDCCNKLYENELETIINM